MFQLRPECTHLVKSTDLGVLRSIETLHYTGLLEILSSLREENNLLGCVVIIIIAIPDHLLTRKPDQLPRFLSVLDTKVSKKVLECFRKFYNFLH